MRWPSHHQLGGVILFMHKVYSINMILIFILTIFLGLKTFASKDYAVNNNRALCAAISDMGFFQKKLLYDPDSRLAFRNLPGPINRGICWWHSRFTRAANYLTIFRPDISQKPNRREVIEILKHIRKRDKIVEIPGYQNLFEFSQDHKSLIEKELNRWSILDSFNFKLINGIIGHSKEDPKQLETMMDNLYYEVQTRGRVVFQTLQLPGLSAHSWLVVDIVPTSEGYEFSVVDSNYYEIRKWNYARGQTHFSYSFTEFLPVVGPFVPYTNKDWQDEEDQIIDLVQNYCRNVN